MTGYVAEGTGTGAESGRECYLLLRAERELLAVLQDSLQVPGIDLTERPGLLTLALHPLL